MSQSTYGGTNTVRYTNTPAGRLYRRTWARGITTTYTTNAAGDIVGIDYSGTTPDVTFTLDRLGRPTNIVDGAGSRNLGYTDSGLVLSETGVTGTLAGLRLTNGYNNLLLRTKLAFLTNTTALVWTHAYAYDGASRLTNVSDGTYSAASSGLRGQMSLTLTGCRRTHGRT